MKMRCIRLGGILEVPHDMPLSEIVDKVIDFVEAHGWTYGGGFTDLKGDPDCEDVEEMSVINLETARKLKDAGLEWEPKAKDVYWDGRAEVVIFDVNKYNIIGNFVGNGGIITPRRKEFLDKMVFAPRLDQLLAEIERRGYWFSLARESEGHNYSVMLWQAGGRIGIFYAATPEEAAAQALLWILEKEREANV